MSTAIHSTKSPRQLYNIAKNLGIWDPAKIDLTEDKGHWQMLNPEQREQLIKTCAASGHSGCQGRKTPNFRLLQPSEVQRGYDT